MTDFRNIVVLTGAGISADSGLKTFRGSDGLWEGHRVEDVATPEAFLSNPTLVQNFYNQRRKQLLSEQVKPNPGHHALAELEKHFDGDFLLVTQNVDNLHERAGSKNLLHMHGELVLTRHVETEEVKQAPLEITGTEWRPHIVWFGEMPLYMNEIEQALVASDLFISIGTSGHVYPAAGFVEIAKATGSHCIEVNLENTNIASSFHESVRGNASETLPRLFEDLQLF